MMLYASARSETQRGAGCTRRTPAARRRQGEIAPGKRGICRFPDELGAARARSGGAWAGARARWLGLSAGKSTIFNLVLRFYDVEKGRRHDRGDQDAARGDALLPLTITSTAGQPGRVVVQRPASPRTFRGVPLAARAHAGGDWSRPLATPARMTPSATDAGGLTSTNVGEFGSRLSRRAGASGSRWPGAFLENAPILLLDEPTSALDREADAAIGEALTRLARGRTTLIIALTVCPPWSTPTASRWWEAGRVVESGTHAELMAKDGRYAQLFALQFKNSIG
jgi:hypothetical protein